MAPTDIEQLERMLSEERPEPDADAAQRIDARVRAVRERRRLPSLSWPTMRQLSFGGAAATLLIGLAVGVGQIGEDESTSVQSPPDGTALEEQDSSGGGVVANEAAPSPPVVSVAPTAGDTAAKSGTNLRKSRELGAASGAEPVLTDDVGGGSTSLQSPGGNGLAPGQDERVVERSATITISGDPSEVREMADQIVAITDRLGGIVVSASVDEHPDRPRESNANLEIAVPVERLDQALADISEVGSVETRTQSDLDVTSEAVSVKTSLRNARETRNALRVRLEQATDPVEIEEIRVQIERAERRVASRKADVQRLANRTQFARVYVGVVGNGHGTGDDGNWSLGDAWDDAVEVLRTMAGVGLITAAIAIPLALLLTLIYLVTARQRRRSRESALDE